MKRFFSYISGISLLGLPTEMYVYGTQLWVVILSEAFVSFTMAFAYLPVFYGLGITSSYEVCTFDIFRSGRQKPATDIH